MSKILIIQGFTIKSSHFNGFKEKKIQEFKVFEVAGHPALVKSKLMKNVINNIF